MSKQNRTPILRTDCLYILVGSADEAARHLKIVNEGGVISKEGQNIDDMTLESEDAFELSKAC